MKRVQFVHLTPTLKDRTREGMSSASYSLRRMPGLRRPMTAPVPAGAFSFGNEPAHRKTDEEKR